RLMLLPPPVEYHLPSPISYSTCSFDLAPYSETEVVTGKLFEFFIGHGAQGWHWRIDASAATPNRCRYCFMGFCCVHVDSRAACCLVHFSQRLFYIAFAISTILCRIHKCFLV